MADGKSGCSCAKWNRAQVCVGVTGQGEEAGTNWKEAADGTQKYTKTKQWKHKAQN